MADNTSTATLFLDGNELEAKSFLRINDMLQRNKTLKHLSVNYVMLGDLGARTVSEGFAKNNTVKVRNFRDSKLLTSAGALCFR